MKRALLLNITLVLCLVAGGGLHRLAAQGSPELDGGWVIASWQTADGQVDSMPQRGLFLFTESGHYSVMYVAGDQPRAQWSGATMTDAEKMAAYDSFIANAGRYSVQGTEITYEAYLAKNPNYMANFGTQAGNAARIGFSVQGDLLTLRFLSGNNAGQIATLRRAGRLQ